MGIPAAIATVVGWDPLDHAGGAESAAKHQLFASSVSDAADGDSPSREVCWKLIVSEMEKYITPEEAYDVWLSAVDLAQGEVLSKAMFKKLYPLVGKKINHSTMTWALGKAVAAMISASEPGSPEVSLMTALAIHLTTVKTLRAEPQVGHA